MCYNLAIIAIVKGKVSQTKQFGERNPLFLKADVKIKHNMEDFNSFQRLLNIKVKYH